MIRVLFVDDERLVLDALKRTVRKVFDATFAEGGQAALDILRSDTEPFSVMCTDMRMPGIDGLAVLTAFRAEAPDTTRILLTGQADLESAVGAVNVGSVFRFLTKPTNPDELQSTIEEAYEMSRLRHAERELLEQTLRGSVKALSETLSLANPLAFARSQRIRGIVMDLLDQLQLDNRWEIEVAAMLSQVGAVTLPTQVSERLNHGAPLGREEEAMVAELPMIADRLLAGIPRLENVRNIIVSQNQWQSKSAPIAAKVLHLAGRIDTLRERGLEADVIDATVKDHFLDYGNELINAFEVIAAAGHGVGVPLRLVPVADLMIGMVLGGDVHTADGLLLVGRGQVVSESLLARIRNFEHSSGLAEQTVPIVEQPEGV